MSPSSGSPDRVPDRAFAPLVFTSWEPDPLGVANMLEELGDPDGVSIDDPLGAANIDCVSAEGPTGATVAIGAGTPTGATTGGGAYVQTQGGGAGQAAGAGAGAWTTGGPKRLTG